MPPVDPKIAMTITPASALSRTSSTRDISLHSLKTQITAASELALDSAVSSQPYPSPSALSRPSLSDRVRAERMSERSPSPHTRAPMPGSMSEVFSSRASPGLIRRLSRGAHNRLRRRASTTQSMRMRDQSAGPVLVRRRSDSNGGSDYGQDVSDLDLDSTTDDIVEEPSFPYGLHDRANALGIRIERTSNVSIPFEGGEGPTNDTILQEGMQMTKLTKKRTKKVHLWLDPITASVRWHPTKDSKSFLIDDVREVRVGVETRNARDGVHVDDKDEALWMTVVYVQSEMNFQGRNLKTMHLQMPNKFIRDLWCKAFDTTEKGRREIMNALSPVKRESEKSIVMAWRQAMSTKPQGRDQLIDMADARTFCRKLQINCSDHAVQTHFKTADKDNSGLLTYEQFRNFVDSFKERKDVQALYRNLKLGLDTDMDLATFLEFVRTEQGADVERDNAHWVAVFDKYSVPSQHRAALSETHPLPDQRAMNLHTFRAFLGSSDNDPLTPRKADAVLDRPLNEYFISSSHNTYLLGRQLAGQSSVEGYIAALTKSCRCIEIDCWDGEGGRPMVTHGRTMTTKIPFEDCVSVIAKYAFQKTPYPLIISLEVHCNPEQQAAMVTLMNKYFDGMLVTEPITNNTLSLPSPEELKHRILIKVKASEESDSLQAFADVSNGRSRARSLSSAFARSPSVDKESITSSPMVPSPAATSPSQEMAAWSTSTPRGSTTSGPTMTPSSSADDSDGVPASAEKLRKRNTSRIVPILGRFGVYTQGISHAKHGFNSPAAKAYNHIFSFSTETFNRHTAKNTDDKALLETHNMRYLMRVYPGRAHYNSSNFNPLQAWRRGVQMAALNWQTYDLHQQINEAMFAAGSDKLGYVLKPDELRHAKHLPIADTIAGAPEKKEKKGKKQVKFSVNIVSAQRLPRPHIQAQNESTAMNPYVEFEMYSADDKAPGIATGEGGVDASAPDGYSGIDSPLRRRTRLVEGNGFDPMFGWEPIEMTVNTKNPSLIFVRWTVWHAHDPTRPQASNNVLLAQFTAKLSSLQPGYRHLPLFNPQGEQYRDARLFVRIRKEIPVTLQQDDPAYGIIEQAASPRPEPVRPDRSWPRRVFSRNPSERRRRDPLNDQAGPLSRTSSMDRESVST